MNWIIVIDMLAPVISAITACIAVAISYKVVSRDNNVRRMDIHSKFQSEMREIQKSLPASVNDENWQPSTPKEKRLLTMYWYLVFDEWLICTRGDKTLQSLWNTYYINGVKSALRMAAFKKEIEVLMSGESTFLGHGEEFKKDLNEICRSVHGRNLQAQ
jgi:hypothetical protein